MIHSLWNRKPRCHWRQYLKCSWNRRTWIRRRKTSRYKGRLIWRRLLCWGFRKENLQLQPAHESMQRQLPVTAPLTATEAEHKRCRLHKGTWRDRYTGQTLDATRLRMLSCECLRAHPQIQPRTNTLMRNKPTGQSLKDVSNFRCNQNGRQRPLVAGL